MSYFFAGARPDIHSLSCSIGKVFPDALLVQLIIEKGELFSTGSKLYFL